MNKFTVPLRASPRKVAAPAKLSTSRMKASSPKPLTPRVVLQAMNLTPNRLAVAIESSDGYFFFLSRSPFLPNIISVYS